MTTATPELENDELPGLIRQLAVSVKPLGFDLPEEFGPENRVALCRSPFSPIAIRLEIHPQLGRIYVLPWVRTSSWDFDGERTDIHDATAIAFAALVSLELDFSVSLNYGPGWAGKAEMDTVFVELSQPHESGFPLTASGVEAISRLFFYACLSVSTLAAGDDAGFSPSETDLADTGYSWEDITPWAEQIAKALYSEGNLENATFSKRLCPSWSYFHDWKKRVAVLKSEPFLRYCRGLLSTKAVRTIEGEEGRFVISKNSRHLVPYPAMNRAARVLNALGEKHSPSSLQFICLENRVLFFGTLHTVAVFCKSGRPAFELERDHVRFRFEAEAELLFPTLGFTWADKIPDDQFESLICDLLAREPSVSRVRRAGVTRERDAGRDLIVEWLVPSLGRDWRAYEKQTPMMPLTVVAQCKACASTVGKGKVSDIRDTIEFHGATGYFLAVSSEISGQLINHLEHLKRKPFFVEWWTRLEIEERLRRHPDIAARYPSIVRSAVPPTTPLPEANSVQ